MSDDGLKVEYTEGVVTLRMEIRSNDVGEFERALFLRFADLCRDIFNERAEVLMATQGASDVDLARLIRMVECLKEEVMRLEVAAREEFHCNTCLQSRSCHCKGISNDALEQCDAIATGAE